MIIRLKRQVVVLLSLTFLFSLSSQAQQPGQSGNRRANPPQNNALKPGAASQVNTQPDAAPARQTPRAGIEQPSGRDARPVLLYSRYYNAQGESRYLPDGTYKEILSRLTNDFVVRVHSKPLSKETLADVKVLLIANPSDKAVGNNPPPPHVGAPDLIAVTEWVFGGGGLIVMGNQEDHNLEVNDMNRLLKQFGLQMTNLYTDSKLIMAQTNGLLGGLRFAYYTGNLVTLIPNHPARPRALINNDMTQKPVGGTRDQNGILAAVSTPGAGRVVVVTDSGWISNAALSGQGIGNVAFKDHDNLEIFKRMARWVGQLGLTRNNIPPPAFPKGK